MPNLVPTTAAATARFIPLGYIATDEALGMLLDRNDAWSRWRAAGCPRRRRTRKERTLQDEADLARRDVVGRVVAAIRAGELTPCVAGDAVTGSLGSEFWADDLHADLSLYTGRVRDHFRHEGAALCFDRAAWDAWWTPAGDKAPDTVQCRVKLRKPTNGEIMAWYAERVAGHDPQRLPLSRPDDEKAVRQYFEGLGLDGRGLRVAVRSARASIAPLSWQARGAKSHEAYDADRAAKAPNLAK
jgi:hypothetical protein